MTLYSSISSHKTSFGCVFGETYKTIAFDFLKPFESKIQKYHKRVGAPSASRAARRDGAGQNSMPTGGSPTKQPSLLLSRPSNITVLNSEARTNEFRCKSMEKPAVNQRFTTLASFACLGRLVSRRLTAVSCVRVINLQSLLCQIVLQLTST